MPPLVHRFLGHESYHEHTIHHEKRPAQILITAWVNSDVAPEEIDTALSRLRKYVETCYMETSGSVLHFPPLGEQGHAALKLPLIARLRPQTSRSLTLDSVRYLSKKIHDRYAQTAAESV